MPPAEQIANAFVTQFFEGLARDPASLTEFYGHHAVITINDYEKGIIEAYDGDVRTTFQKWASILKGSQLSVESVNAAPIFSGINVFVSFSSVHNGMRQYYHMMTSLEFNPQEFTECYYIRHQIISRIGAAREDVPAPVEEPAAPAPAPVVEKAKPTKQAAAPAKEEPAPAPRAPEPKKKTPEPEPEPEVAAAPAPAEAPATREVQPEAPAAPAAAGKPKSWASLAGAGAKSKITGAPVRVVAHDPSAKPTAAATAAAPKATAAAADAPAREHKREPRVHEPVGDCLMFNTKVSVTDDEIKAALGAMASSLVSLRNNSATGRVFMDFAQGVNAFDEIRKADPSIGGEKIAVYRQKERAQRRE